MLKRIKLLLGLLSLLSSLVNGQLSANFYATSCANLVSTVTSTINALSKKDNVVPPSTLRLFVHDCFVQGCDASILIKSTPGNKAERDASDNANIPQNAFDAITQAKQAVEAICPGVVSCADILALAARDVVVFLGGPSWDVPLGRRDSLVSQASLVSGHLPLSGFNVAQLTNNFGALGLNLQDVVVLSGGHTVGFSHCSEFINRLYNFNNTVKTDPSLDPSFVKQLEGKCPQGGQDNFQAFDLVTPFVFDNQYYKDLQVGKGLLFSDQILFQDDSTKAMVNSMASSQDVFFKSFVASMIKMSSVGVKLGSDGEVRKDCSAFNPKNGNPPVTNPPPVIPPAAPTIPPNPPASPPKSPISTPTPIVSNPPKANPPTTPTPSPVIPPVTPNPPLILPPPTIPSPVIPPTTPNPPIIPPPPTFSSPVIPPVTPNPPIIPPPPKFSSPVIPPATPNPILPPTAPNPPTFPRTPTIPPATPSPPSFTPSTPSTPSFNPNPPSRPGFTIPGIPGFTPPISIPGIPRFRIPGFGGPPPSSKNGESSPSASSNDKSVSDSKRSRPGGTRR